MAAIVAEEEPLAGGDFDGAKIVLIPILFVDAENAIGAQAGRQQVLFAGQLMFPNILVREREINSLGIGGNRVGKARVMPDGTAIAAVHLEDMRRIEVFVGIGAIYIENPLSDLERVAG
jgi:hypothetical protein